MKYKVKKYLSTAVFFVLAVMVGCSNEPQVESGVGHEIQAKEESHVKSKKLTEIYRDIYDEAIQTDEPGSLEMMQSMINKLGENGYTAIDSKNQTDMTESDEVIRFCEQVDAKEEAELSIIVVLYSGGFIKYDFRTEGGSVDIVREYYQYIDGHVEHRSTGIYRADSWQYTEEGYLLFEGHWFSEQYALLVAGDVPEYVGLRVKPLDEKCRELNRQYILPIGYGKNNMFIADWSEDDFGELNFYDLFDIFYPLMYGQYVPYTADENLQVGAVYRIPKEEFEAVIMACFNIDSKTLQSKTTYYPEDETYEYKPRGFYEIEYPDATPFPEVTDYVENSDGTVLLTVNPVLPEENTSKVYAHEVVIRPLDDGGVQYVSNHIIPSNDNGEPTWHVPRLTAEEWEGVYGNLDGETISEDDN